MAFPCEMSRTLRSVALSIYLDDPVIVFFFLQQIMFMTSYAAKLRAFSSGFNFVDKISNPIYTLTMNIYNDNVNESNC